MLGSNALTSTRGATDNGDMQAMGVHLFRGESTSPRTGGPPPVLGSVDRRPTSPGAHCSSDTGNPYTCVYDPRNANLDLRSARVAIQCAGERSYFAGEQDPAAGIIHLL